MRCDVGALCVYAGAYGRTGLAWLACLAWLREVVTIGRCAVTARGGARDLFIFFLSVLHASCTDASCLWPPLRARPPTDPEAQPQVEGLATRSRASGAHRVRIERPVSVRPSPGAWFYSYPASPDQCPDWKEGVHTRQAVQTSEGKAMLQGRKVLEDGRGRREEGGG